MDKLVSAEQAISAIKDGMTVGIGGWGPRRKPMALIRELLRSPVKDLTIVSYGGADVGMLCAAGKVKKLIFAFTSLDFIPLEPWFRKSRQNGEIDIFEIDEGMMLHGLRAAAWGVPFIPTAVGLGTDVVCHNPDLKIIESPYDDKEWVAMPALKLDVSLIHATTADRRGVCQIKSPDHYMDDWFARAAKHTIVSCEDLIESDELHSEEQARFVFWDRSATQAVVHIPGGAHPSSSAPLYGFDVNHFKRYAQSAVDDDFNGYLSEFGIDNDEASYQKAVGGLSAIQQLPLPVY
jgi:glutaconate CoA-transferase subunit A